MKPRVVVIDDEADVLDLLGKILQRAGYDVVTAASGELGLQFVRAGEIDCLVVDKLMPRMGGLEVIAEARRRVPRLPVVMVTAHPEPFKLDGARPDVVLPKPFKNVKAVEDAVAAAIESAKASTLEQLTDRVVAVVSELAPLRKKRD